MVELKKGYSEDELHTKCAQFLFQLERFWKGKLVWTSVMNEGKRGFKEQRKVKNHGVRKGWPDIQIIFFGKVFFIELKSAKGRPTKTQLEFVNKALEAGAKHCFAYSFEEFLSALQSFGLASKKDIEGIMNSNRYS